MRNLLYVFMMFMFAFAACTNEIDVESQAMLNDVQKSKERFFGVKYPEGDMKTRGVSQGDKLWHNGTTISVKFLNDPYGMKDKVKEYAKQWEEHANIKFDFVESGDALVRIGFDWNDERHITWSYIGTDCKSLVSQKEATMSFAYFVN